MGKYIVTGLAVIVFMVIFVGVPYIRGAKKKGPYDIANKRDYVMANLDKFKVNNEGSSMDENEIYLLSREKMGFKDVKK